MIFSKNQFLLLILFFTSAVNAEQSTCYGTTANGHLQDGVKLPSEGANFISYSTTAEILGRTYVHSKVRKIVLSAYKSLETETPEKVYKYAETGFKKGGQFKPHKTHRNGLSVDFMVPVTDKNGTSVHLPTHYLNKLGYSIEFDRTGKYKEFKIDFDAMAAHIVSLNMSAVKIGSGIRRVIFYPELQPFLMKSKYAEYLKKNIKFSRKKSWVKHDEHYHVDFDVACKKKAHHTEPIL